MEQVSRFRLRDSRFENLVGWRITLARTTAAMARHMAYLSGPHLLFYLLLFVPIGRTLIRAVAGD